MTAFPPRTGPALDYTADQLAGQACHLCGSTTAPLHPDGTIETQVDVGVVRDNQVVICTTDLTDRGLR